MCDKPGPIIREHFGLRGVNKPLGPNIPPHITEESLRQDMARAEAMDAGEWTPYLDEAELEERRERSRAFAKHYPVHSKSDKPLSFNLPDDFLRNRRHIYERRQRIAQHQRNLAMTFLVICLCAAAVGLLAWLI